jgi:hypothetical protein
MGLDFAIDELYATGWTALDSSGCLRHTDGRWYPGVTRVTSEFKSSGFDLSVRHIQLFDCFRAEWKDAIGTPSGAVVGRTQAEAAVYALSHMRRRAAAAAHAEPARADTMVELKAGSTLRVGA